MLPGGDTFDAQHQGHSSDFSLSSNGAHSWGAQTHLLQAAHYLKRAQGTFLLSAHDLLGCLAGSPPDLICGQGELMLFAPNQGGWWMVGAVWYMSCLPSLRGQCWGPLCAKSFWKELAELNPCCSQQNPDNTPPPPYIGLSCFPGSLILFPHSCFLGSPPRYNLLCPNLRHRLGKQTTIAVKTSSSGTMKNPCFL